MNATIKSYKDMVYDSRPVKFSEFISDKYDKIHKELYLDALEKCIDDYVKYCQEHEDIMDPRYVFKTKKEFKRYINVIELKNTEYWKPSYVVWRTKYFPYRIVSGSKFGETGKFEDPGVKGKMSLEHWWNMYQKFEEKTIDKINIGGTQINDFAVIYLNYVAGTATLRSRSTDKEIVVPFEYLNENTEIDDTMLLNNTFTALLNINKL